MKNLPPSVKEEVEKFLYRAMKATREAFIATVEQETEEFPKNSYERDIETDRKALEETIGTFNHR